MYPDQRILIDETINKSKTLLFVLLRFYPHPLDFALYSPLWISIFGYILSNINVFPKFFKKSFNLKKWNIITFSWEGGGRHKCPPPTQMKGFDGGIGYIKII